MVGIPSRDGAPDMLAHGRMARELGERSFAADELVAAGGVEPGEHADAFAVLAGDDGVLQRRRGGGERADPERAHGDPGAGGELEVLGQAAVEHDALCRLAGIGKAHGVARLVEAILVEGRAREIGPFPIAGRHVRAAHAHFELVADRHELELDAGHRHADRARALDHEMRGGRQAARSRSCPMTRSSARARRLRVATPLRAVPTGPAASAAPA